MTFPDTVSMFGRTYIPKTTDPLTDYYVVLHDFETETWNYKPRSLFDLQDGLQNNQGYPETCRLRSATGKGTPFTESIQWHSFNLCLKSQYGFAYSSTGWKALTREQKRKAVNEWTTFTDSRRFWTNHAGTDLRANFVSEKILGTPLKSGLPIAQNIVTGGNVVLALRSEPDNLSGEACLEIKVWDGKDPVPTERNLVHLATNSTPFPYQDRWRVDPFPFFGGKGSPYFVLSHERQWIPLNRVRRLKKSELFPRPYYP